MFMYVCLSRSVSMAVSLSAPSPLKQRRRQ
jgi:hypothetical protein